MGETIDSLPTVKAATLSSNPEDSVRILMDGPDVVACQSVRAGARVSKVYEATPRPIEAIEAEIEDAIGQTNGRRLIVGPGSTPLITTPAAHFRAARQAIE